MSNVTLTIEPEGDEDGRRYTFDSEGSTWDHRQDYADVFTSLYRAKVLSGPTVTTLTFLGPYTVEIIPGRRSKVRAELDGKVKKSVDLAEVTAAVLKAAK